MAQRSVTSVRGWERKDGLRHTRWLRSSKARPRWPWGVCHMGMSVESFSTVRLGFGRLHDFRIPNFISGGCRAPSMHGTGSSLIIDTFQTSRQAFDSPAELLLSREARRSRLYGNSGVSHLGAGSFTKARLLCESRRRYRKFCENASGSRPPESGSGDCRED